jgi:hypothetical protein
VPSCRPTPASVFINREGTPPSFSSPSTTSGYISQRKHQRPAAPILSKGTDLSVHTVADLDAVATELNDRPRKRLAFAKPIEELGPLLLH